MMNENLIYLRPEYSKPKVYRIKRNVFEKVLFTIGKIVDIFTALGIGACVCIVTLLFMTML